MAFAMMTSAFSACTLSAAPQRVSLQSKSSSFAGAPVRMAAVPAVGRRASAGLVVRAEAEPATVERLRLHNLSPLKGSRKKKTRKGRGHAAGQGGSCGFGMRGQKSRSGPGVRPGFEGGQTPMYRRFPKLKGIAGGMGAGKPKYVTVNVRDISAAIDSNKIDAGAEVTIESLKSAGVIKATGYYRNLPLKVLGSGDLSAGVTVKAASFSESATSKIEAAGGSIEVLPGRVKWTREAHEAAKKGEEAPVEA